MKIRRNASGLAFFLLGLNGCGSPTGSATSPVKAPPTAGNGGAPSGSDAGSGGTATGNDAAGASAIGAGGSAPAGINVVISPRSTVLVPAAQQTFSCTVSGTTDTGCTWNVVEAAGGTITAAGLYTAPSGSGTYHVKAASTADSSKTDTATVVISHPTVANCDSLPAAGTWENITPPEVMAGFGDSSHPRGVYAFAVDPQNSGTIYLGTFAQKVWKTTDCGSTWTHISTGRNGAAVDSGDNWTFVMDPTDPKVLYTNSGYGSNTAYKSTNGGVDWDEIWPPSSKAADQVKLQKIVEYNFANVFAIDPFDHQHLLLTFHAVCAAPYNSACLAETKDGGATWRLMNGDPSWNGTEGQVVYFLDNSNTWIWASQNSGFWRTEDGGTTWKRTNEVNKEAHPQGSQIYRAKDGTFYLAASDGVSRSANGKDWTLIPDTGPLAGGLVSDGTTMYLSTAFIGGYGKDLQPMRTAPEATGQPWTKMPSPGMKNGGILGYDPGHHVLYASNFDDGFFRVVVK